MIATAEAVQAPPHNLIDPRVAKHGGTRNSPKSTYTFGGTAVGRRVPSLPPPRRSNRTKGETQMDFTDTEQEILVNAWLLAREGKGQVLEDWAQPDAERLCAAGWIERRTVDANGDTCWFWTSQAEAALDMNALRRNAPADLN